MVDVSKITPTQEYIIERHARMVGKVLDLIEGFKNEPLDKNMLMHILKIQTLTKEIDS